MVVLDDPLSRRAFLGASCAVLASSLLAEDLAAVRESVAYAVRARGIRPPNWQILTAEQASNIDAVAAQIMPSDETPGAREAGVVNFIDHALATWAVPQRQPLLEGLAELNRQVKERWPEAGDFAALRSENQTLLLQAMESTSFFQTMRFFTLLGMFSLPAYGGNAEKSGWRMIGFEDRHTWEPPFGYYDAESMGKER